MTDTAENSDLARAAALAALLAGTPAAEEPAKPAVVPTGREVYAGGDIKRILLVNANIMHLVPDSDPKVYAKAMAEVGDTVLLDKAQAERLEVLDAVADPEALPEPANATAAEPDVRDDGTWSDAHIAEGKVEDLAAYVGQYPDERPRVRAIEETRAKPRVGVLSATEPTPEADAERAKAIADQAAADAAAAQAKADEDAKAQQEAQEAAEAAKAEQEAAEALAKLAGPTT